MGSIELKVGKNTYDITKDDLFIDNGACVQLLTQSNEKREWGHHPNPVLSKRAIKELSKYKKIQKKHHYDSKTLEIYSLEIN